jgi:hypothetical protein
MRVVDRIESCRNLELNVQDMDKASSVWNLSEKLVGLEASVKAPAMAS